MDENVKKSGKQTKGGRNPKNDKANNCVMVRFTNEEYARFLTLFEESGVYAKAIFIKARVFNETFRVVKIDRSALEFVTKLTSFHAQIRAVGVNYNQVVAALKSNFTEKKALAYLYKLEKATLELKEIYAKVFELSQEFNAKWSQK